MKLSVLLTAVLSVEAVFGFPHAGLKPLKGRGLVARVNDRGGGSSSGQGGHRDSQGGRGSGSRGGRKEPLIGYNNYPKKNPEAGAVNKERVAEITKNAPKADDAHIIVVNDRPKAGTTAIHKEFNPRTGKPRFTAYLGSKEMPDHCAGMIYREGEFPNSRDAEYVPSSKEEHDARRKDTLARAPQNPKDENGNPLPGMNEEKPPASASFDKVWLPPKTDFPPPTVIKGSQTVSSQWDGPLMDKVAALTRDAGEGATMRYRANPTREFAKNPPPVLPVKGPTDDAYIPLNPDGQNYVWRDPTPFQSEDEGSGRSDRSRSPKSDNGDKNYRVRSDKQSSSSGKKKSGSGRTKRDAVDQAAHKQASAESDHPTAETAQETFDAQYQEYVEAYLAVRSNATDLIMPFIGEMVNGSNSNIVWAAAWEIMSLADPDIIVLGGPVAQGMHCFEWMEDGISNKTDNETMSSILAIDGLVIDAYQTAWNQANDALESSGLQEQLKILRYNVGMNMTANSVHDNSNTDAINQWFLDGPNSEIAGLPDGLTDEDILAGVNGTDSSVDDSTFSNGTMTGLPESTPTPGAGDTNPAVENDPRLTTSSAGSVPTDLPDSSPKMTTSTLPTGTASPRVVIDGHAVTG
ncbi:MAG: hypothetical protein LQ352_006604 [Teloschistes flavicans]|nr:MAG: hypothetical protein LQ352_006604 [Teloschistes flavicans]